MASLSVWLMRVVSVACGEFKLVVSVACGHVLLTQWHAGARSLQFCCCKFRPLPFDVCLWSVENLEHFCVYKKTIHVLSVSALLQLTTSYTNHKLKPTTCYTNHKLKQPQATLTTSLNNHKLH